MARQERYNRSERKPHFGNISNLEEAISVQEELLEPRHYKLKERYPSNEYIQQALNTLIVEQKQEIEEINLQPFLSRNPQKLFEAYTNTQRYYDLCNKAKKKLVSSPGLKLEDSEFRRSFAGKIFSDIAYLITASKESPQYTILSPEHTSTFYNSLFPEKKIMTNNMLNENGLSGVSIPDGILINHQSNNPKIIGLLEYTTAKYDSPKFEEKYSALNKQISRENINPGKIFSPEAKIIFVVPSRDISVALPATSWEKNVEFRQLPITFNNLTLFINEARAKILPPADKKEGIIF